MIFFLIYYSLIPFVILGYGYLSQKILLGEKSQLSDIGLIGFFGLFFIYFLSSLFHFFLNINNTLIYITISVGLLSFIYFFLSKKIKRRKVLIVLFVSIIFLPISIIAEPNEDFFLYYFPYLKYLESSKIIFGLTNLNDFLAYSTNSIYDIIILLQFPLLKNNSYAVPILYFYIFFVIFFVNKIIKDADIFYILVLSLSVLSFSKLRDFGTSIPPQLLLILIGCLLYEIIHKKLSEKIITAVLFLTLFAIILRFNSIIIFPIFILFFIKNITRIIFYIYKNKIIIFYLSFILILFISKNFIQSGCLIYPAPQFCFSNLDWSSDIKIIEKKYNKLQSDSKGWPFYAKEKFKIEKKFVWKNLSGNNFVGYNEYAKLLPTFWFQYWIKDPNYKKIINIAAIALLIYILAIINLQKKREKIKERNRNNLILLIFSFFSILMWFYLSPQLRYGGYFCFIYFFSLTFKYIFSKKYEKLNKINIVIIFLIALGYVQVKNFNRLYEDFKELNFINYPWPNYTNLKYKEDFVSVENDNLFYNKRIYSKNLIFDNSNEYILMCGDIDFPCISEGKEVCLGNKEIRNNYSFFIKNKDNKNCLKFMNNNILY